MFATLAQYSALRESLVSITSLGFIGGAGIAVFEIYIYWFICSFVAIRQLICRTLWLILFSGVEGGQGNNDAIYGSHDDHDTFGVLGEGWQGPGNGEDILDLYNPGT